MAIGWGGVDGALAVPPIPFSCCHSLRFWTEEAETGNRGPLSPTWQLQHSSLPSQPPLHPLPWPSVQRFSGERWELPSQLYPEGPGHPLRVDLGPPAASRRWVVSRSSPLYTSLGKTADPNCISMRVSVGPCRARLPYCSGSGRSWGRSVMGPGPGPCARPFSACSPQFASLSSERKAWQPADFLECNSRSPFLQLSIIAQLGEKKSSLSFQKNRVTSLYWQHCRILRNWEIFPLTHADRHHKTD